ncbi:hypothetical protein QQF64_023707 [Cirrhinus molitorella]|uniref:Uncharacterized protein n=1 Tax=Cirrhinus molitorella TaxID=172907 RepID=A0ABR3NJ89_9TELE
MARLTSKEKTARYRQKVNSDPAARAEYLARKRESYQRRKHEGKIPYVKSDELSERERNNLRNKWKAASRGYRERRKMEKAMLDLTPQSIENTLPDPAGVELVEGSKRVQGGVWWWVLHSK